MAKGPRIAILGAGPVGLEAALAAHHLGLPFELYERGRVGEHVRRWGHIKMFTPFAQNSTPLGLAALKAENPKSTLPGADDFLTGLQYADTYLEPLATTSPILDHLHLDTQVIAIGRSGALKSDEGPKRSGQPFRLLFREAKGREFATEADVVLDCTGTFAQPRWLGDGGIPAVGELAVRPKLAYGPVDVLGQYRQQFAGKTTLVIGTGCTAATNIRDLAELAIASPETWVIWLGRGPRSQPIGRVTNDPLKERDRLAAQANHLAARGDRSIEFHPASAVTAVAQAGESFQVTARVGGKEKSWTVDRVLVNTGFMPDTTMYRELQMAECPTTQGLQALATALQKGTPGAAALKNPEPNFFVLGAKSYGRNSHFFVKTGFDQVREAFALLLNKPDLTFGTKTGRG